MKLLHNLYNFIKFFIILFIFVVLIISTTTSVVYANHTTAQSVKYDYDVDDNFSESNEIQQKNNYDDCRVESSEVFFCQNSKLLVPKNIVNASETALNKGNKFFKQFSKRNPFGQQTKQLGKFTEFSVNVPGDKSGYTKWVKVVNQEGKTIKLYHDTFDNTGKFLHRGIKLPGPERHVR